MQDIISIIGSLIIGIIGGGSNQNPRFSTTNTTDNMTVSCYNPEQEVTLTLNWTANFQNVTDPRPQDNPKYFKDKTRDNQADIFNDDPLCKTMVLRDKEEKTYIRVRQGVRISSCKTDELAGSGKPCSRIEDPAEQWAAPDLRGKCEVVGYADLRKVADVEKDGQNLEVFWVPLSHNVNCYKPEDIEGGKDDGINCGPGPSDQRSNFNLRDFVYVRTARDAFPESGQYPFNNQECDPLWDQGSTNENACSHYFDVYMAKDIWDEVESCGEPLPTEHPLKQTDDFFCQAVKNCQEKSTFSPIEGPGTINADPFVLQSKSLKLKNVGMRMNSMWTWATPWCKPAVYLYPEKETEINVKLSLHGKLTYSDPPYNNLIGWKIIAKPDGQLSVKDTSDGGEATTSTPPRWSNKTYPYLYYEADIKGIDIPDKGWVFPRNELKLNLNKILLKIGFNDKEVKDFMDYWLPKLKEKPWYFVTLIPEDLINVKEKLILSQNPDTLIRTRVVFEGLDSPLTVSPLTLPDYKIRSGFTVTDWGGTIIGRSCTDLKF